MAARSANSDNQVQAAALAFATGKTVAEAAEASSTSVRELYRWRKKPAFQRLVARRRDEITAEVVGRLCALGNKAVATLDVLMDDPLPRIRLGAAKAVMESLVKATDLIEVRQRLEALEQALVGKGGARP
jgi:hypothetical protein